MSKSESVGTRRDRPSTFTRPRRAKLRVCAPLLALLLAAASDASGKTLEDPIELDASSGSLSVPVSSQGTWVRVRFATDSTLSHLTLETRGSLDTEIQVFVNRGEALREEPVAEADGGGQGGNAALRVPLGFPSPYFVRVRATTSGSTTLRAALDRSSSERCDWPAGCPLALAAREEPTRLEVLALLRRVRAEVLAPSEVGRELIDLYWRLGRDLIPDLLTDADFRRSAYRDVTALLPLADQALAAAARTGGRARLRQSEVEGLQTLLERITPRISPGSAAELRKLWRGFDLAGSVGLPLDLVLDRAGLLPASSPSFTVVVKLRNEPPDRGATGSLRPRTGVASLDARLTSAGVAAVRRVHRPSESRRVAGLTRTIAFEVEGRAAAHELAEELNADPEVEWAEVSSTLYALATGPDPYRNEQWGLDAIRAAAAWPISRGACSTPVAIVDTGLRKELGDLRGRVLVNRGYDFVDDDADPQDGHGHGTHVGGIVASIRQNAISVAGVAPESCIFGVKVLSDDGEGSAEGVAAGIVHAVDEGARVINLSLGCDCEAQQVIEDALRYAARRDVLVVAAAGNDGAAELYYPASSPRALSVAALAPDLKLASFSNHGPGLDVAAPGETVVSLFPDGESCSGSGTSMAAPHVAGVAALVRSANPSLDAEAVADLIRERAVDLGPRGYDTTFGAGMPDAQRSAAAAAADGPYLTSPEIRDFRFKVRFTSGSQVIEGRLEPDCVEETLCVSGALAGRSELFVRVIGPRPNGFLWANLVRFTPARVEVWLEQISTGAVNYYDLPPLPSSDEDLTGLVDKQAFRTGAGAATGAAARLRRAGDPGVELRTSSDLPRPTLAPDVGQSEWLPFTSEQFPGFRFRVRILAGGSPQPSRVESDCLAETICVSGSLPGRSELFLRIIGPRPNGFLWVNLVRFTTSRVEVEIEQRSTGITRIYVLDQVPPGDDSLGGRVDREAFPD